MIQNQDLKLTFTCKFFDGKTNKHNTACCAHRPKVHFMLKKSLKFEKLPWIANFHVSVHITLYFHLSWVRQRYVEWSRWFVCLKENQNIESSVTWIMYTMFQVHCTWAKCKLFTYFAVSHFSLFFNLSYCSCNTKIYSPSPWLST